MTQEQELAQLRSENATLRAAATQASFQGLGMKVSEKGALSVYGLGRFPVTLYKEQWRKLLAKAHDIEAFLAANDTVLKVKPAKEVA